MPQNIQNLKKAIELIRQTKIDEDVTYRFPRFSSALMVMKHMIFGNSILKKLRAVIPKYEVKDLSENEVAKVVAKAMSLDSSHLKVKILGEDRGAHQGATGAVYALVSDKNTGKLITFVKGFSEGPLGFFYASDIWAMWYLKEIKADPVKIPEIQDIGWMELPNKSRVHFILMEQCPGIAFVDYLEKLSTTKSIKELSLPLSDPNNLFNCFRTLGKGLASLHWQFNDPFEKHPLHPAAMGLYMLFAMGAKKALKKRRKELDYDVNKACQLIDYYTKYASKNLFPRGVIHGDAHFGNYIYDEKTGKVCLIDFTESAVCIGKNGLPIGVPACDIITMFLSMTKQLDFENPIGENAIKFAKKLFIKGYFEAGGSFPSHEEMRCLQLMILCREFHIFYNLAPTLSNQELKVNAAKNVIQTNKNIKFFMEHPEIPLFETTNISAEIDINEYFAPFQETQSFKKAS